MRINQLKVAVRPRHPYEAADLGVLLWQTGGAGLYKAWLWLMLPLTVAMIVLEHLTGSRLALLVLWWLKPLLDYLVLWQLSRRVFGDEPTPWQSLRSLPGFFGKGLPGALTLRRLSLSRAYVLPVRLLEELSGSALQARILQIRYHQTSRARWLIQIFMMAEMCVFFGLMSLAAWFAPAFSDARVVTDFLDAGAGAWQRDVLIGLYALAVTLVEPCYVAAGFLLYLNRRTDLEAWDIEIAFRQLADRLQAPGARP